MKKILILLIANCFLLLSCSKHTDVLDVDMDSYNTDKIVENDVDKWVLSELTNPFNIEVVYRFDRNLTDVAKDIAPPRVDKVKPLMEAVLNLYLKPYQKVAGNKFIKTFTPKQYVLYGSVAYNSNGSVTLGTADGGRKVTLFDVNNFLVTDLESNSGVRRKLRTIHHEFTHILNQNVIIPPEFAEVTKADYYSDWTNALNTVELSKSLGFVSRYARSQYTEDFAEMTAHLLVEGQVWFDNYVLTAPRTAQPKLRRKEALVVQYFKDAFGIDFRELQQEVQASFKTLYNAKDPEDLTQTFSIWLLQNKIASLTYDPAAVHYTTYGRSATFNTMWTNFRTAVEGQSGTGNARFPKTMTFNFASDTTMTLRIAYLNNAQTSSLNADFDFTYEVDPVSGEVKFSKKMPEGGTTEHGNGQTARIKPYFEQFILPYLVNRVFIADWLPSGIGKTDPLYRKFGGFYEKGVTTNYFYGPIVLK